MTLLDVPPAPSPPERLRLEAARTCDRLRTMSLVRLRAPLPDGRSRARAALDLAQLCADEAATLAARPHRSLPELPDQVSGDALATCAQELVEELAGPRTPAMDHVCSAIVDELIALRRTL